MPIEILVTITTLLLIGLITVTAYLNHSKRKAAQERAQFEASVKKLQDAWMPVTGHVTLSHNLTNGMPYFINTDELLGMQSAAYAEYEAPSFIQESLDRRLDIELVEDDELPSAFKNWRKKE